MVLIRSVAVATTRICYYFVDTCIYLHANLQVTLTKYFDLSYATARLQPTTISKYNTAVQLLLVTATLAAPIFDLADSAGLHALWYITAASTVASGYSYVGNRKTFSFLLKPQQGKPPGPTT